MSPQPQSAHRTSDATPTTNGVTLTERVWPERTCVACRRRRPANEMLRIARTGDGPRLDVRRRLEGRGCHVCPTPACVERAVDRDGKSLRRALRCDPTDEMTMAIAALRSVVDLHNEEHQ